ncbi:HTH-type transcriptional repressor YvoA [bacterium BMS3Bbin01]|nr:HTH-type transcriptional repressor YvoA [bacterium BMS3Bbin01]
MTTHPRRLLADQVRDDLLARIHDGSLTVGAKLPAEPKLCEEFGVSRATIREAVRSLAEAGYLHRVHGLGTYVAFRPRLRHSLGHNLSYTRLIQQAGLRPNRRVLGLERTKAGQEEATALGIGEAEVVRIERIRSADDRPVIYSVDTIPETYVPGVTDEGFGGSLYELFERMGYEVAYGEATLAPVLADEQLAEHLQVDAGSPLLRIVQVDYTTVGDAIMFSREWHVPGVFELSLLRRAT